MRHVKKLGRGSRLLVALAVGGAAFGIASAVQASIPSANGVIHGCYGKPGTPQKGELRVRNFDQGEQCRFYENTLDWNQIGPTGPTGATGPTGPIGPSVRAYTYMNLIGGAATLDPARTKNFSGVTRPATGIYCLTPSGGVTEAGSAPSVTVEWGQSSGNNLSAYWRSHSLGNSCPNSADFEVRTYRFTAGGDNTLSDNVAFTIVVP
jgi:hypothetical protein